MPIFGLIDQQQIRRAAALVPLVGLRMRTENLLRRKIDANSATFFETLFDSLMSAPS